MFEEINLEVLILPRERGDVLRRQSKEEVQGTKCEAPGHRQELPGKVISFHIVPLDPAYEAGLTGHVPVNNLTFSKEVSSWEKG
jgi:hypothetical protein